MDAQASPVYFGEIQSGILQNSTAISPQTCRSILASIPHQPVRVWERPVRHAASPEGLTGADCTLPSASGARVRGVGTAAVQTWVVAGRVLQVCARTELVEPGSRRRMPWSYYLTRPGRMEPLGRFDVDDLIDGFFTGQGCEFELGGLCVDRLSAVQRSPGLDRRGPLPARRTRLRWAATAADGDRPGSVSLRVEEDLRTVRLRVPASLLPAVPDFCRDLALHDWLLSCAVAAVDQAGIGVRDRQEVLTRLSPLIDQLLHIWMPGVRIADGLAPYWAAIERRAGLSRQWETVVRRVRDQWALAAPSTAPMTLTLPGSTGAAR
jgi:hypothetical protein